MASITIGYFPILLFVSAFLWIIFVTVTKQFQNILNIFIVEFPNVISEQTVNAAAFPVGILTYAPAVILIAIAIWALVRASNSGGE